MGTHHREQSAQMDERQEGDAVMVDEVDPERGEAAPAKTMDDYAEMDDKEILAELGITDISEEEFTDFLKDVDQTGGLVTRDELRATSKKMGNKKFIKEKVQKWLSLRRKLGGRKRVPTEERQGLVDNAEDDHDDRDQMHGKEMAPNEVLPPTMAEYCILILAFFVSVLVGLFMGYGLRKYVIKDI